MDGLYAGGFPICSAVCARYCWDQQICCPALQYETRPLVAWPADCLWLCSFGLQTVKCLPADCAVLSCRLCSVCLQTVKCLPADCAVFACRLCGFVLQTVKCLPADCAVFACRLCSFGLQTVQCLPADCAVLACRLCSFGLQTVCALGRLCKTEYWNIDLLAAWKYLICFSVLLKMKLWVTSFLKNIVLQNKYIYILKKKDI